MIVVVDDDPVGLSQIQDALQTAGYDVGAFSSAESALDAAAASPPELIISDVMMPEMDGIEFRKEYARRFPDRATPFVFLSSISDPAAVVRGLDSGGDDYLAKPVSAEVLKAKIRVLRRSQSRPALATFKGDLGLLSVPSLLKFCETKGLTGFVRIEGPSLRADVHFHAGVMDPDTVEDCIDEVCSLEEGDFTIYAAPMDFAELAATAREPTVAPSAGRLSAIRFQDRILQLQTEYVAGPRPAVVTLVVSAGRTLWKTSTSVAAGCAPYLIERTMDEEHTRVSAEVQVKLHETIERLGVPSETLRHRFHELFDQGYDLFRSGDFRGALQQWEKAHAIDPSSKVVEVNMRIARSKAGLPEQD